MLDRKKDRLLDREVRKELRWFGSGWKRSLSIDKIIVGKGDEYV